MDRDIVRRAQAGDHDAFAALARDAVERLYGTARLILLREDLARVAAEDALTTAWRDIRGLRDPNQSDPWLLGILVRSCQAITRNERRYTVTEIARGAPANNGESDKAFGRLTQDDRAVLALAFFAGLKAQDLSVASSIPAATTDARLDHAQAMLLAELDADDTAESRTDLAWRLRAWMAHEATPPDLTGVVEAVVGATAAARQRRRPQPARRWIGLALVTALALTVAVTAGVFVAPIVRRPADARPVGVISPSGEISVLAGDLPRPVIAVLSDGRVLVVGLGDVVLGGIVYDPTTGSYGEPIRDHILRRESTATTLQNNLVLLTGGTYGGSETSAGTTVLFDPFSETFATTNPLTIARARHTATLLDDGRVLVTGGHHFRSREWEPLAADVEASAEIYDPATGQFSPTGRMIWSRAGHAATKLADGRVLVTGGYTVTENGDTTVPAQAEIFDPAAGVFIAAGSMTVPRGDHSATLLADGRVLIVGGADQFGAFGEAIHRSTNAEIFDPITGRFTPAASLVTERAGHSATLMADGRVFIAGGQNEDGGPRSSEIFDPIAGTFAAGPRAAVPHHANLAPLIGGGRIFLTGSGPGASEVFDPLGGGSVASTPSEPPATGPFSPVEIRPLHDYPPLVELHDGRILIVGGADPGDPEQQARGEIFDPSTGLTTLVGPFGPRSWWNAATRLSDGRVVVVGSDQEGRSVAEIFDPEPGVFEPAPGGLAAALSGRHLVATSGLPDGRLILNDDADSEVIRSLDAETGMVGAPIRICGYAVAAIALDAGRILVSACEQQAVIADMASGTVDVEGVRFDRAFRLDGRRIALAIATYESMGQYENLTERITSVYDQSDDSVESVPTGVRIGGAVAVAGDRLLAFGSSGGEPSADAVAYDTRTWAASELPPMLAPRSGASSVTLRDGRVLIVGGVQQSPDRTDPVRPGAELFDPTLVP